MSYAIRVNIARDRKVPTIPNVSAEIEGFSCPVTGAWVTLKYFNGTVHQTLQYSDTRIQRSIVRDYGKHGDLLVPLNMHKHITDVFGSCDMHFQAIKGPTTLPRAKRKAGTGPRRKPAGKK